jgi:hypothetical protein
MPRSVHELIETLDDASGAGEDAKDELIARGVEIVPELAARVGTLGRFGKLTAIEVFEVFRDQRACPALLELLADDAETVVEWSASALGVLRRHDAIGPLRDVWSRAVAAQVPPDWTGPVSFRRALTDLGARQPVVPSLTARLLQQENDSEMQLVPSAHLAAVVEDLADHDQLSSASRCGASLKTATSTGERAVTRSGTSTGQLAGWTASQRRDEQRSTLPPWSLLSFSSASEWVDESDLAAGLRAGRER